jgi:hypothetical protein
LLVFKRMALITGDHLRSTGEVFTQFSHSQQARTRLVGSLGCQYADNVGIVPVFFG